MLHWQLLLEQKPRAGTLRLTSDCRERAWDRYVAQLLQERDNPALATARREREERDRARTSRDARCENSTLRRAAARK